MKDIEHQLITVNEESLKIGLKIHKAKTKFMTNIYTTDNLQINGTERRLTIISRANNSNGKQNKTFYASLNDLDLHSRSHGYEL